MWGEGTDGGRIVSHRFLTFLFFMYNDCFSCRYSSLCMCFRTLMRHKLLQTSLHGSCPVIKGEKWVATKWIRDQMELD
jgi:hypothetical protein